MRAAVRYFPLARISHLVLLLQIPVRLHRLASKPCGKCRLAQVDLFVTDLIETCLFWQRTIGEYRLCVKIHGTIRSTLYLSNAEQLYPAIIHLSVL